MSSGCPSSRITPAVEHHDPLRDIAGELHLVSDDQHRDVSLLRDVAQHLQHVIDELRVQRTRHLVQQEDVRIHRERTVDRDALAADHRTAATDARSPCRTARPSRSRPRAFSTASAFAIPSTWIGASTRFSITVMFGKRLKCWKTMPIRLVFARTRLLGRATRFPPRCSWVSGSPWTSMYPPFRLSSVMNETQDHRLPGPAGADEGDALTWADGEVQTLEDRVVAEPLHHIAEFDGGRSAGLSRWQETSPIVGSRARSGSSRRGRSDPPA